jgi:hypothetical protein
MSPIDVNIGISARDCADETVGAQHPQQGDRWQ